MNVSTESTPQCLVEDGEGQWFLCPLSKRREAVGYFREAYRKMGDDPAYIPSALPAFLTAISGPDRIHFHEVVVEQ